MKSIFPFTDYDFYAYLTTGLTILFAVDYLSSGEAIIRQENWSFVQIVFVLAIGYVVGQIFAGIASILLEHVLARRFLRPPISVLLKLAKIRLRERFIARWVVGRYYDPLPTALQQEILSRVPSTLGCDPASIHDPEEVLQVAFPVARSVPDTVVRLDDFRKLYGFSRNMSLAALFAACALAARGHIINDDSLYWWALLVLIAALALFGRFLKFYAAYAAEILRTYADATRPKPRESRRLGERKGRNYMRVQIFDVEHGACALVTADNDARLMIDSGYNGDTGWRAGTYLREQNIYTLEMLAITNYDEDHVSGIGNLCDNIDVRWLHGNKSVSSDTIRRLKSEDGMGPGIDRLVHEIENNFTGSGSSSQPQFDAIERRVFWNSYPSFDDANNLSMVVFLKSHGIGILFPGDLEEAGWLALLKDDSFKQALRETSVLIASHHGRKSGCCEQIFDYCKPYYVIISDKGYMYDTQETIPFYRRFAKGGPFRGETRHVLTTRKDGRIGFNFNSNSWWPY